MTAWNTLTDLSTGILVTETHMDEIRENINYLKATVESHTYTAGSDITSTSTSFVDVDATNIADSITTVGDDGILLIYMHFSAYGSGVAPLFRIDVDGTAYPSTGWMPNVTSVNGVDTPITLVVSGLAAGSHTVKLQWKVSSAGTITLRVSGGYQFYMKLVEIS